MSLWVRLRRYNNYINVNLWLHAHTRTELKWCTVYKEWSWIIHTRLRLIQLFGLSWPGWWNPDLQLPQPREFETVKRGEWERKRMKVARGCIWHQNTEGKKSQNGVVISKIGDRAAQNWNTYMYTCTCIYTPNYSYSVPLLHILYYSRGRGEKVSQ